MPYKDRENLYKAQKRHRLKIRLKLIEYLSIQSCIDCGENDPIVLDFDHKKQNAKFKDVSKMRSGHYSWDSILKEIKKCDIRCANCHRRKTHLQFGFWGKTKK